MNPDVVVIGGGLVGASIAYGLAARKVAVVVLDGNDRDLRASSGNGGLVWLQGKGMDMPAYQHLSRASAKDLWPQFSAELADTSSIDLEYQRPGGLTICLSQEQFERRLELLTRWHAQSGDVERDWEMLDRRRLGEFLPKVQFGPDVVGASFGYHDGQVNPLRVVCALHAGIVRRGGQFRGGCTVQSLQADQHGGFMINFNSERIFAQRVVIAAGLASRELAAQVGLDIPIRSQRGQILITERVGPLLPVPLQNINQTRQGTLSIGATNEENVGFDVSTTIEASAAMSAQAIRCIPALGQIRIVRHWAALRIMTPDSYPIYAESIRHPGVFVAVCHSGLTLAAAHATVLAEAIAVGCLPPLLKQFHPGRFNVSQVAT